MPRVRSRDRRRKKRAKHANRAAPVKTTSYRQLRNVTIYEARTARIRNEVARRGSANEHSDEAAAAHGVDCTRHERITIVARRRGADEHPDEAAARTSGLHTTRTISRGDRSRATRECGRALRRSCSRTRARTAHDTNDVTGESSRATKGCGRALRRSCSRTRARTAHDTDDTNTKG